MQRTLEQVQPGETVRVRHVSRRNQALCQRLLDLGVTRGTEICAQSRAPMGDPLRCQVRGCSLAIRLEDAASIEVESA